LLIDIPYIQLALMCTVGDRLYCSNQQVLRRMPALSERSTYSYYWHSSALFGSFY